MKKNNKGMTTVEILVSFILIALISGVIYTTVSNYSTKKRVESVKVDINTYKNILTKIIQDDLIKGELLNAYKFETTYDEGDVLAFNLELGDHSYRRLVVYRRLTDDYFASDSNCSKPYDDKFAIYYGTPSYIDFFDGELSRNVEGLELYEVPDLGFGYNNCDVKRKVKDLRITNVIMKTDNKVLSLFITLYHVDLGSQMAINIVCPINYQN